MESIWGCSGDNLRGSGRETLIDLADTKRLAPFRERKTLRLCQRDEAG